MCCGNENLVKSNIKTIQGVCKVCELVDKDLSIKDVSYCDPCNVWMCINCQGDLVKRGEAIIIAVSKGFKKMFGID